MFDSLDPAQCKVALFAGGSSSERDISIASGKGAQAALEEAGFEVDVFDPANKDDLKSVIDGDYDVAFLCLHGKKGEDGTIQGFLELIDLPYTGSGVWSSSLAIDKSKSKVFYAKEGIPTPPAVFLNKKESYDLQEIIDTLGDHCVVKPSAEGSSYGVSIVEGAAAVEEAIEEVFAFGETALVERYVKGTELTVAVLGNDEPRALPIIEIIPKNASYDFDSKYLPGGSEHICPARLSDEHTARIQDLAVRAHKALGCSGVSRSDFIIEENGDCWILETNTLPGMTGTSLLPDAARVAGIEFPELCRRLVGFALERR